MRYIRFTNDGWYARYDDGLNEANVLRIADAVGAMWADERPGGHVYVGYDTRRDGASLAEAVGSVLGGWGLQARVSDIYCPMPALNLATRRDDKAVGALMLTGDHRSADYLGVRVRNADSSAITPEVAERIEDLVPHEATKPSAPFTRQDFITPFMHAAADAVDRELIGGAGLRCVVDPMHGTARGYAAQLLRVMGVDAIEIHGEAREDFGGLHPEVTEPWVDDCEMAVAKTHVDLGVCIDGPSNRAVAVDERGVLVPTPKLHALLIYHLAANRGLTGRIVVPRSTSTLIRRQAERLGLPLTVVANGPTWAFEESRQGDVLTSGDGLGGLCIPAIDPERNAFVTVLLLLELMAMEGKSLSQLVACLDEKLGVMEYGQRNVRMDPGSFQVLRNLLPGINAEGLFPEDPVAVSHADGIRAQFADDSWVLVRPGETQPLVRIYAEGPTKAKRDALLAGASELLKSVLVDL